MGVSFQPGKYWGRLVTTQLGSTKNGNSQMVFTFTIMGAIDPNDPEGQLLSCANYDRSVYRAITEKTKDWFWRDVDALCEAKGVSPPNKPTEVAQIDIAGAEITLECTHETYEGTLKERWNISHGGGAPEVKPLDGTEAARLDALFGRGKPAAKPAPRRTAKPAQQQPELAAAAPNHGDELPF